jgi:hypothetical protein
MPLGIAVKVGAAPYGVEITPPAASIWQVYSPATGETAAGAALGRRFDVQTES